MKKNVTKTFFLTLGITTLSLIGFNDAHGYGGGGGGGGGSAALPKVMTSINVPVTITNIQSGSVSKSFGTKGSARVEIPKGAVETATTFEIKQAIAKKNQAPVNTEGAFMIGNQVFNINGRDMNDNPVRNFNENLKITLTVPNLPADTSGLGVYYFSEVKSAWVLVPGASFDPATGEVSFEVNHLTNFAILEGNGQKIIKVGESSAVIEPTAEPIATSIEKEPVTITEQVLEARIYQNGTLLRGSDKKIFVVENSVLKYIVNLEQLRKYAGKEIIDVDDSEISSFNKTMVLDNTVYSNGTLLRGSDKKIFVIIDGKKQHIINLEQLRMYAGKEIIDVEDSVLLEISKQ